MTAGSCSLAGLTLALLAPAAAEASTDATAIGGKLLFAADDGVHGFDLWHTDGTGAGTKLLKNIAPRVGQLGATPVHPPESQESVAVSRRRSANGRELWRTDGTRQGTKQVKDINPGSAGLLSEWWRPAQGDVCTSAPTMATHG